MGSNVIRNTFKQFKCPENFNFQGIFLSKFAEFS